LAIASAPYHTAPARCAVSSQRHSEDATAIAEWRRPVGKPSRVRCRRDHRTIGLRCHSNSASRTANLASWEGLLNTATPLERLKDFADKAVFTEDEAREYEKHYLLDRAAAINIDNPFELAR
jgi:hypothetical protein